MLSLSEYINKRFTAGGTQSNRIILFDIDDTLIHTTAMIYVKKNGRIIKKLSNSQYNDYILNRGESFDYSEFDDYELLSREHFTKYWDTLKREYKKGTHIGIITARDNCDMIYRFFKSKGIEIKKDLVFAVGDPSLGLTGSISDRKAEVISNLVKIGYKTFIFFDDNKTNLITAKKLEHKYNIKMITVNV